MNRIIVNTFDAKSQIIVNGQDVSEGCTRFILLLEGGKPPIVSIDNGLEQALEENDDLREVIDKKCKRCSNHSDNKFTKKGMAVLLFGFTFIFGFMLGNLLRCLLIFQ